MSEVNAILCVFIYTLIAVSEVNAILCVGIIYTLIAVSQVNAILCVGIYIYTDRSERG